MDHNPEYLLKLGRKQMFIDKNYEAAEKTFLLLYQMEYSKILVEILLDNCREKKAKHETRDNKIESEGTENNTQRNEECHENEKEKWEGGGSNAERGGGKQNCIKNETKEQVKVKTNSLDNPLVNIHHSGYLLRSKERGEGEMCTRHNLKCNNTHKSKLEYHGGEYQEKNLGQRAMKRHTEYEEEGRKEDREKISHFCKNDNSVLLKSVKENDEDHEDSQCNGNESKHKKREEVNKMYNSQWDWGDEDNLEVKKSSKNTPEESYYEVKKLEQTTEFHKVSDNSQQKESIGLKCDIEVDNIPHTYQIRNNEDVVIEMESDMQLIERDEKEAEMLRMSLTLRAYIIQFGIDAFSQKPNYRPEINFDNVSQCIDYLISLAQQYFFYGNKEACEYYLSEAENFYSSVAIVLPNASVIKPKRVQNNQNKSNESERNTENFTANIATSYKDFVRGDDIDVTKCLKLAESAILAKNFEKAERLIKKSERICQTKNARELRRNLEAAKKEAAELEATIEAANQTTKINEQTTLLITKHEIDKCFEAKEVLNKTEEKFNNESIKQTHDLDENFVRKQNYDTRNSERVRKIVDKPAAEECIQIAEAALKVTDFTKAERMLLKAKRIDPNINIENLQTRIRIAIASRSSTTDDLEKNFQPTNNKKQNSKECVKISDSYLKQKNLPKAIEFLMKAKEYYNSKNLKEKFEHIEKLKAEIDFEGSVKVAEPSFVNSNSETCFANDPSQEVPPSYHISKDPDADTVENYLQNGRSALKEVSLEKAEEYAKKSEQLRTGSATNLLHDINLVKQMRQDPEFQKSRLRSGYERRVPGASKHSEDMRLIADAKQEISEGKIDNNEELKKAERLKPTENAQQLLQAIEKVQNIQYIGTHNNMQNSPSVTKDNNKHTENNINPKNDIEILVKKAEEAYFANDLDSAESLFKQAYDILPDENILSFIKKIKKQKEKTVRPTHGEGVENLNLQEAKKCVKLAEQARDKGDLDKAKCLFIKAVRMNPTDDVQNCLKEVRREKESKIYIENLIKDAKAAYFANDLNTAESLFKQAYEIFPDEIIMSYINEIQKPKVKVLLPIPGEGVHNQNLQEAKKCVELAEQARGTGDLDKAERLFKKALRMNPSDHVQNCLKEVQREKESKIIEKENQEKTDMFVSLAVKAFESGANYSAEKYLQKALRWYNSDTTKQMLDTVQKEIKRKINEKKSKRKKKIDQEKEEEMKIEADKHLKIAEEQIKQGDLENARFSALISDSFFPSEETKQLLHLVFNEQCKEEERAEYNEDIKSEKFIECAKSAIAEGDFKLAKKYLMHSNKLKKSVNTTKMIFEVTAAINHADENTFSLQKVWGIITNFIPSFKN